MNRNATAESRHEPDSSLRETRQRQPRQGTSPTTPPERRNCNSRVKARARQRLNRDATTTAESRHEPDSASRETKQRQPSQGKSPTAPQGTNYNSRVKARARQRLKRDETTTPSQGTSPTSLKRDETIIAESRHEPDNASLETKLQQPSQGISPTRLKRDEQKLKRDSNQHQHYRMP